MVAVASPKTSPRGKRAGDGPDPEVDTRSLHRVLPSPSQPKAYTPRLLSAPCRIRGSHLFFLLGAILLPIY